MNVEPITLDGRFVRLEPLRVDHIPGLCKVGLDGSLWEWTTDVIKSESDLADYVRAAIADQMLGRSLPFVTIERSGNTIVGSTRFGNIEPQNRKTEIGWTWIGPKWQRTVLNTEAKLLMLIHAFEVWKCIRVEFKTDINNEKSKNALRRIGAVEEGVLRNHMITENGRFRDSIYFSIIDSEWNSIKLELGSKVGANI